MLLFCILIVVMVTQIYTWVKNSQNYTPNKKSILLYVNLKKIKVQDIGLNPEELPHLESKQTRERKQRGLRTVSNEEKKNYHRLRRMTVSGRWG